MPGQHGDFIWYELMSTNPNAAVIFYSAVIGWRARAANGSARDYWIFSIGEAEVAGMMKIAANTAAGMRPCWLGYVGADDVDAAAADIVQAGGTRHVPPTDIPGIGRFALLADPQGAMFYVMRSSMEGGSTSFAPTKTGHCSWNELATDDQAAALAFYRDRFGWEKGDVLPMGEMGDYQFITHHGQTFGAVMTRMASGPRPGWTFYFAIDDIDLAARTVGDHGGAIHHGPSEIPGGSFIIIASDPQGAMFGLVGPRKH
jgi:uncharacterized protein